MSNEKTTSVNIPLSKKVHSAAKSKAALSRKTLREWLANVIAEASK